MRFSSTALQPHEVWMIQMYTEYESVVTVGLVEATVHAMDYRV